MKKLLLALALLWPLPAAAGVSCSVPYNLTNGTTADASQVMANYNAIIACLANAAASGANSDITSLNGLTTPLVPGSGGTPVFIGGTVSGTNAQIVGTTSPNSWTNTAGYTVVYVAAGSNTGAATLQVGSGSAVNIYRQNSGAAPGPLVGGEIATGQTVVASYDGTEFQLLNPGSLLTASLTATDQNLSGGAIVTVHNNGSFSGGVTYTPDCGLGPLQNLTNAGNFNWAVPANNGSCVILVTNSGSAGTISFSGLYSAGANTGDPLDTTNGHNFMITVVRIGIATYFIKATQ